MSDNVEKVTNFIRNEIEYIDFKWAMFRKLYRSDCNNINIMKSDPAIENLFLVFQELLIDDTILALSKLADPAKMGPNSNASFKLIIDEYTKGEKGTDHLEECHKRFIDSCVKLKTIRNKKIGHNDKTTSISNISDLKLTLDDIDNALNQAKALLEAIYRICNETIVWSSFPFREDPVVVLNMLKKK